MVMRTLLLLLLPASYGFIPQSNPSFLTRIDYSNEETVPSFVESAVLKEVYPTLLDWKIQYGHPNVPLGTPEGRQCQTLRRLHIQGKLTKEEETLLSEMGFRFNSLEDVYFDVDFDDLFARLLQFEEENQLKFQVPKKYALDPELGAWVTGIRRLGANKVDPEHAKRLNGVGFAWKSNRQCGSKFMKQFREYKARAELEGGVTSLMADESVQKWIAAQRSAHTRGTLSETRFHYMEQLFGDDWMESA